MLDAPERPDWYKAALCNELYYLVDGGTFWADREADGVQRADPGPFALLECFDYPFYNTLDVYFYASFALVHLWPDLARRVIRDFVATVDVADDEVVPVWATGGQAIRKVAGALPHDVGGPAEDPFVMLNSYHLQDMNGWKDLNPKFVLLVWQAVELLQDAALGAEAWPAVVQALRYVAAFDRDGDGLPEHDGVPDQTYDTWPMRGPSAYGGSLWLAALRAGIAMGERVGDAPIVAWLHDILDRALPAFEARSVGRRSLPLRRWRCLDRLDHGRPAGRPVVGRRHRAWRHRAAGARRHGPAHDLRAQRARLRRRLDGRGQRIAAGRERGRRPASSPRRSGSGPRGRLPR